MMASRTSISVCPADEQLRAFALAHLPPPEMDEVEQHVKDCETCIERLDGCDEESDTLIQALATLPSGPDDEAAFQQLHAALLAESEVLSTADLPTLSFSQTSLPEIDRLPMLLGGYELQELIGRGASGAVYRAQHLKLDRTVAVKVLNANYVGHDSNAIARFQREMKAVGSLDHPHIVRATDAGEQAGRHYLVMEYVAGVDVSRLLRLTGPMRVSDACEIVRQAAEALHFAHQHGLVHRDVKPSNLLFTQQGTVKLLDLGLVGHAADLANNEQASGGLPHGTADYMSPEQWTRFDQVDARADIYSLGCTLYKLLIGKSVFPTKRNDYVAKMQAHLAAPVPSLRTLRPEVPLGVQKIVQRMLAKKPEDRYASAQDVAGHLTAFAQGSQLPALSARVAKTPSSEWDASPGEASTLPGTTPPRRTRRWLLGAAAAASVPILAGFWRYRGRSEPALVTDIWRDLSPVEKPAQFARYADATRDVQSLQTETHPASNRFELRSDHYAIWEFGRPVQGIFTVRTAWSLLEAGRSDAAESRVGVFFRYRPFRRFERLWYPFQTIEWTRTSDDKTALEWNQYRFSEQDDASFVPEVTHLARVTIEPEQEDRSPSLQVTLGRVGFPEVRWNDQPMRSTSWSVEFEGRHMAQLTRDDLRRNYLGRLGVFVHNAAVGFRRTQLAYLS